MCLPPSAWGACAVLALVLALHARVQLREHRRLCCRMYPFLMLRMDQAWDNSATD